MEKTSDILFKLLMSGRPFPVSHLATSERETFINSANASCDKLDFFLNYLILLAIVIIFTPNL